FDGPKTWAPPIWLVVGSWPLEVLAHYTLSAMLAGERLSARPVFFREPPRYQPLVDHPMYCGGKRSRRVSMSGPAKLALLEQAIDGAGLLDALDRRAAELGKKRAELRTVIKPNFMFLYSEKDRSTFTDPELVEALVDWLRARGLSDLAIVEAQS